jgi:pSer/pThr/pTyr-binding forkhead associated (FHA) protein
MMPKFFHRKKDKSAEPGPVTRMRGPNPPGHETGSVNPLARRFVSDDEPDTIDLKDAPRFQPVDESIDPPTDARNRDAQGQDKKADKTSEQNNPVSGFLVVINGPGQGAFGVIRQGVNPIGSSPGQAVVLDFGDDTITAQNHCLLTFDPQTAKYYLQHGGGEIPTFINDSPVVAPVQLHSGDRLKLGQTTLLFRPLCGEDFSWETTN